MKAKIWPVSGTRQSHILARLHYQVKYTLTTPAARSMGGPVENCLDYTQDIHNKNIWIKWREDRGVNS